MANDGSTAVIADGSNEAGTWLHTDTFTAMPNSLLTARRLRSLSRRSPARAREDAGHEDGVAMVQDDVRVGMLDATLTPAGSLIHLNGDDPEIWPRDLVCETERHLRRLAPDAQLRLADTDESREAREAVDRAAAITRVYWPEAAVEMSLLVRACIHVHGPYFKSGTSPQNLGIVMVNVEVARDLDGAIEHLLHEAGHSALHLSEHFESHLRNPDELAAHPLRDDLRPLSGVLHACIATFRVVSGLFRMRAAWSDVPGIQARFERNSADLEAILDTLSRKAEWTSTGARLFDSLNVDGSK